MQKIYADHAATTPIHPEVRDTMIDVLTNNFGNPSSIHHFGRQARKQLDESRAQLASTIGASPDELILTSGGTEADNLAIIGFAKAYRDTGTHIITSAVEHHAVLHTCERLEKEGFQVTYLPVDEKGMVSASDLESAITEDTILVSIMHGNNETGTVQPVEELARIANENHVAFHTDAVQTYGHIPIDVTEIGITLLSVSSHKINGPNGAGFLYVKKGTRLTPSFTGGEQERKRRAGTENLAAIAGFAKAAEITHRHFTERAEASQQLTNYFLERLRAEEVEYEINGTEERRLPHIVNVYLPGIQVESFLVQLDFKGIAASSGSACTAGSVEPSHVLEAMFKDRDRALSSVRFSFGTNNTLEEMEYIAREIKNIIQR
ncbi:cysteine desulfurase family protein [Alteribacillus iranensis]|uniref:Cysteine desulfurase n=1 Tax=Alteribacillus iranensis TaxID=930128 RepID=A0A1I1Z8G9_9BACI|nr:cysteine desulfurase family protein [Alteribacillus iranensis]SFE27598.1 cysteine desulfurase [Alteribacillus iranensis]